MSQEKQTEANSRHSKRVNWFLILAVFMAVLPFVMGPSPFAKLDDFAVAQDTIAETKIVEGTFVSSKGSRNTFYELHINTSSGQTFYLRRPDTEQYQVLNCLTVLLIGQQVSIRFRDDSGGHQIYDVRNEKQIFIPFSEIMAYKNKNEISCSLGQEYLLC
jgi:hypothetical protein